MNVRLVSCLVASLASAALAQPVKVELKGEAGHWQLLRDGKPYVIQGAGGEGPLPLLASLGANSTRTWGADNIDAVLDEAHKLGLTVTVGIWLGHPRHGFNYNDPQSVATQFEAARAAILKYRNHPAVLMWGIGNEMEGEGDNAAIWSHINCIASMAKQLDPNHPTMTVLAEMGKDKVTWVNRICPDIDIIGFNTYASGLTVGDRYAKAGGTKPFVLTEFGPAGTWEIGRNDFGTPTEPTSTQKAATYRVTYEKTVLGHRDICLGSYAFLWGQKVEATTTWFGMLLADHSRLGPCDVMTEFWTGKKPANLCPVVEPLKPVTSDRGAPGTTISIALSASDPEHDPLTVEWVLKRELTQYETGGDAMAAPEVLAKAITRASATGADVRLPDQPGAYRLYAFVRDGKGGAATATIPLLSGSVPSGKK
jgi:Glycosyl hydrolases family 2, TIM barrel domain